MSTSETKENTYKSVSLYSKLFRRIKDKIRRAPRTSPIEHKYKNFSIILPDDHMLPTYQRKYPKYDRFLPHIVKYFDRPGTIVDVGANIGDTLASMVEQNSKASYICVEADDSFYELLEKNIGRIKKSERDLKVCAINKLVGKSVSAVSLEGRGGTKHAVPGKASNIEAISLDDLIQNLGNSQILLLKSDVDGFDYDVLDSATSTITSDTPILFFELHLDHEYQKHGYLNTIRSLESMGYCDWTIFDNFGEVIVRSDQVNTISNLMDYIWKQNIGNATRTIYYLDILAVQKKKSKLIDVVLREYEAIQTS